MSPTTEDIGHYEPTQEEIQQALERLRKQKAYRADYQTKRKAELEANPEMAAELSAKRREYFEANKDKIYESRKAYYENNKDKIKEYHKKYNDKKQAIMKKLRADAKSVGMKLEEYLESIS